jgi:predicted dehydrogenase
MGYHHGSAAQATPGLELVAACDESAERRKVAETEFPGVRTYSTVAELVRDDDVEVVVVATPPVLHAGITLELLRAGKHVACEKPLCFTVEEADHVLKTARAHERTLTVNQSRRWDADFVAIRRAVGSGLLGELFNVETFVGGFEHPCRAWHSEESVSGGAVFDWGSHHLDWILLLMGDTPSVVEANGHKRVWHDVTNLDQLRVRLRWSDGREAEFVDSSVAGVRRPKFYLQGTEGTLAGWYRPLVFERLEPGVGYVAERAHHAEAPAELTLARYEGGSGVGETHLPVAAPEAFAFHRNLADHLALGEPLAVTPEAIRRVVVLLEIAHRSAQRGGDPMPVPAC